MNYFDVSLCFWSIVFLGLIFLHEGRSRLLLKLSVWCICCNGKALVNIAGITDISTDVNQECAVGVNLVFYIMSYHFSYLSVNLHCPQWALRTCFLSSSKMLYCAGCITS